MNTQQSPPALQRRDRRVSSAVRGRYLPPEWAPQSGVMLTWPHGRSEWADQLEQVEAVYVELACCIAHREKVLIVCLDPDHRRRVRERLLSAGIDEHQLDLRAFPSNDTWARDHGPVTVRVDGELHLLDFRFNGWGNKYPAELDNAITKCLHEDGAFDMRQREEIDMVLEGGSIEVDGAGTLLTTLRCLLAPTRNPQLGREQIERRLIELLGVTRILWLQHGAIPGDDTDGHIDTLARFCDERTILYVAGDRDGRTDELDAMERELAALRRADGMPYRLVALPHPRPLIDGAGQQLPVSYANFLIINDAVLVPVYGDPADKEALQRIGACFPARQIIAIDARPLIQQRGGIHCAAMHLPAGVLPRC